MKIAVFSRTKFTLALTLLLSVLLPTKFVWAQSRSASKSNPTTSTVEVPTGEVAYIRFWKTELKEFSGLRLTFRTGQGSKAVAREVGTGGPGYVFSDYVDVPAERGMFELFAGQDKQAIASLPVDLTQNLYATVLVSEPAKTGGIPSMELIDDREVGPVGSAQISVRSFVADLKDVRVSFGEKLGVQFDAGLGYLLMRGITPASYRVQTTGTMANGEHFNWLTEMNLQQNRRQTLLIYPDPYGRIRPRISIDGKAPAIEPE